MTTRMLLLSLLAAWMTSACGEVKHCKEGEVGCVDGDSDDNGKCYYDLVEDPATGKCVEPQDDMSAPDPNAECGSCASGEACRSDGMCINVCTQTDAVPTDGPSLPACQAGEGEPPYDFQNAAIALCKQACARRAALCPNATCNPAVGCTPAASTTIATALCGVDMTPKCVIDRCVAVRDNACAQQLCAGNTQPNCAGVTCSNTCNSSLVYDGICDDGDLSNAVSALCPWGTDCGDCGPRRGTMPPRYKEIGQQCIDPYQCGAPLNDFSNVPAWCVAVDQPTNLERCVPDCSVYGRCPDGYSCEPLKFQDENGDWIPLEDDSGKVGKACFPAMCGK
jgi:hypothetical protein